MEEQYKAEINKRIEKGDMEEVCETPLVASDPKRHINYLPQLVIQRQDKINSKVRPVLMLQAKIIETSLLMIISCVVRRHKKVSINY